MSREYFLVTDDPSNPLVRSFTDDSAADVPTFTRSDAGVERVYYLKKNPVATPGRPFIWGTRPDTLRMGMGVIDALPDSGTYTLTGPNGGTTAAIQRNADAATIQAALRAGWTSGTDIIVTLTSVGYYEIDWGNTGAETGIPSATPDGLIPSGSTVSIVNTQDGTSLLNEKWVVRLHKAMPFLNTSWDALPGVSFAAALVTTGSATQKEIHSVTWNSDATGGNGWLQISHNGSTIRTIGPIPYNVTTDEFKALIVAGNPNISATQVSVGQTGPGAYRLTFDEAFTNAVTVTVGTNTFEVPVGDEKAVAVSTAGADAILGSATTADVTFEIEYSATAGAPSTLIQETTTLRKDLLGASPGYQTNGDVFVTTSNIRALTINNDVKGVGVTTSYGLGASNALYYGAFSNALWVGDFIAFYNDSAAKMFYVMEDGETVALSYGFLSDPSCKIYSGGSGVLNVAGELNVLGGAALAGGLKLPISTKTDNYTATSADHTLVFNIATAKTLTLPAAASHSGRVYSVKNLTTSADALTIDGNASETIDSNTTHNVGIGQGAIIQSDGSNWHVLADI